MKIGWNLHWPHTLLFPSAQTLVHLKMTQETFYKCNSLSFTLTDSDWVGLRWIGGATVGSPWMAPGESMNYTKAWRLVFKYRALHQKCQNSDPASTPYYLGQVPKPNFLICKRGDFIGLFEFWVLHMWMHIKCLEQYLVYNTHYKSAVCYFYNDFRDTVTTLFLLLGVSKLGNDLVGSPSSFRSRNSSQ